MVLLEGEPTDAGDEKSRNRGESGNLAIGESGNRLPDYQIPDSPIYLRRVIWSQSAAPPPPMSAPMPAPFLPPTAAPMPAPTPADDPMITALFFTERFGWTMRSGAR